MTDFPELGTPDIDSSAYVADTARIAGNVTIGAGASVWYGASIRAEVAPAMIGARSNIQDNCVIHTDDGFPVIIGEDVTVGHAAVVHGATVDKEALIGMGAILLNGSAVGEGALVAAGCVVPPGSVVPAGKLAVGNPMRILRDVNDAERASAATGREHYQHYAGVYKSGFGAAIAAGRDELMGLWDKVTSVFKSEASDAKEGLAKAGEAISDELDRRQAELDAAPHERVDMILEEIKSEDDRFAELEEMIREQNEPPDAD